MLSIPHLIIIFIVALVVFGPEKLPELARTLGKVMAEFRRHTTDLRSSFEGHLRDLEREAEARRIAPPTAPAAAAPAQGDPAPAPASPGTVPSDPPYAAALPSNPPVPEWEEPPDPDLRRPSKEPDAFGLSIESAPVDRTRAPEAATAEKTTERVSDGSGRPS
jgi:TatA/E family protein of Tat protein translocase